MAVAAVTSAAGGDEGPAPSPRIVAAARAFLLAAADPAEQCEILNGNRSVWRLREGALDEAMAREILRLAGVPIPAARKRRAGLR